MTTLFPIHTVIRRTDGLLCVMTSSGYARDIHGRDVNVSCNDQIVTDPSECERVRTEAFRNRCIRPGC